MVRTAMIWASCAAAMLLTVPASAQEPAAEPGRAGVIQALYDCRAITDAAQRLACFDRQVTALQTAETARDVRIVDREQVRRARRGLFGLTLPSLGDIFGGGDDEVAAARDPDVIEEIESVIREIGRDSAGKLVLILENGQRWTQTEVNAGRSPRAGQSVRIRRGALGSFLATVDGRAGFRVRRDR